VNRAAGADDSSVARLSPWRRARSPAPEADRPRSFAATLLEADPPAAAVVLRRRLLPAATIIVVSGAWVRWFGEREGLYGPGVGVIAMALLALAAVVLVVWHGSALLERAERRRTALEAQFRRLVEQLPLVVYVDDLTDASSNIYTSPQVEDLLGYTVEEWVSDPDLFVKVLHPDDRERVLGDVRRTNTELVPFQCEYRLVTRDGGTVWIHDEATIHVEDGVPVHSQGYMLDITRRRLAEEELRLLAASDPLTLLANRTRLLERLRATGDGTARSLLFLDLDDFKTINDSLGHRAGDGVLVELALRIERVVAPDDLVARVGGDEFAVLTDVHDETTLGTLAGRLLAAVGAPVLLDGSELRLGASVGIATGDAAETLLRDADLAMYEAKRRGGNGFAFFVPDLHVAAERRLALLADLGRGDLLDELVLHYQPTFDLHDGSIEGVEALVRWQHPRHGLLAPAAFVPAAEESGGIVEIGRWVLHTACREAAAWPGAAGVAPVVAVNVSARQLRETDFVDDVRAALGASGLTPSALRLEVTESDLLGADETGRASLAAVSRLGVQLAIDDFGTGSSWIGNLRQLAPNVLKIDRSFVAGAVDGEQDLLRGLLALARELDLTVIAEGIETDQQLDVLRRLRCQAGQGFRLARPMPAAELLQVLARSRPPLHAVSGSA